VSTILKNTVIESREQTVKKPLLVGRAQEKYLNLKRQNKKQKKKVLSVDIVA
jgi:hypothetical protein